MQTTPKKFVGAHKYRMIVSGIGTVETTRKIGGIGGTIEVAEFYEGGNPNPAAQLPTTNKWDDLTVERGRTLDHSMRDWFDQCASGRFRVEDLEREVTIQSLDGNDTVLFADTYSRCKCVGYKESDKDSKPGDIMIETMTIKHMGRALTRR